MPPLPWAHIRQSTIAFGQGISVTPLQILTGVAAVANGGVRVEPRLIDRVVDAKGQTTQTFPVKVVGRVLKQKTCDELIALLKRVVADQAFPLELKVPNAATRTAMAEADEIAAKGKARFESADNVMADLEKATGK